MAETDRSGKLPYHQRMAEKKIGQPKSEIDGYLPDAKVAYSSIKDLLPGHEEELDTLLKFASVVQWNGGTFLDVENFPKAIRNLLG